MTNTVYIATSLDGYIADENGGLDWLHSIPNPEGSDFGFAEFMDRIDALVMGRNTFETVCGFGGDWPYPKPVFVVSSTLTEIPEAYQDKAQLISGTVREIMKQLSNQGYQNLYIDGGKTVQSFLQADLIDELIITQIPILLGTGIPLFGALEQPLKLGLKGSETLMDSLVKTHYIRQR